MSEGTLTEALDGFGRLPLESLSAPTLLDRIDTKFVVPVAMLPGLFEAAATGYDVLTVRGSARQQYHTTYFDSPDLAFYREHHGGRAVRSKVRVRRYDATGDQFLEVKLRRASGRTVKHRAPTSAPGALLPEALAALPEEARAVVERQPLVPVVATRFERVALVRHGGAERTTIDTMIAFSADGRQRMLTGAALVEVKQEARGDSPVLEALRESVFRARSVSKYCLAVAMLLPHVKHNRFKPLLACVARVEADPFALPLAG